MNCNEHGEDDEIWILMGKNYNHLKNVGWNFKKSVSSAYDGIWDQKWRELNNCFGGYLVSKQESIWYIIVVISMHESKIITL